MNTITGKYNPAFERYVNGVMSAIADDFGFKINTETKPSAPGYENVTSNPTVNNRPTAMNEFKQFSAALNDELPEGDCGAGDVA